MATLTIRNLDDRLKRNLRLRAARHGWSMEQEVRLILAKALSSSEPTDDGAVWLNRVRQRFQGLAGDDWCPPARNEGAERELPRFDA